MSDNSKLWEAVQKTNPNHTKQVNFGRKITAIDPYRQLEAATAQFGPAGKGWGWEVKQVEYLPTNEVCILISLWHSSKLEGRIEQWGQASLYIDKLEKKKDTDCMKKATTDGITKCLSCLGFNTDIFLGKYDDNKYVQDLKEEFKEPEAPPAAPPKPQYSECQTRLIDAVKKSGINGGEWCKKQEIADLKTLGDSACIDYIQNFEQGMYND